MIDLVYKLVLTLGAKDLQGYLTPEEFNELATLWQMKIFRGYFEDSNRDKLRQNKGMSGDGYANLPFNQQQLIQQFADTASLTHSTGTYNLPADLYLIEDHGINVTSTGRLVDQVERKDLVLMNSSPLSKPSAVYPVYERFSTFIKVHPSTFTGALTCRYLRTPKNPKWTYYTLPNNAVVFDPSNPSYQDFELHESELPNLVIGILSHFGIMVREDMVVKAAESINLQTKQEDNS